MIAVKRSANASKIKNLSGGGGSSKCSSSSAGIVSANWFRADIIPDIIIMKYLFIN